MTIRYSTDCSDVNWKQLRDYLIEDEFHNGRSLAQYEASFKNSHTVVLAYDDENNIVGTARALSDGVCNAYVVDVWTYTPYRKQGIATAMMKRLFANLQGQHVFLWTDDAQGLYKSLNMREDKSTPFSTVVGNWLENPYNDGTE